MKMKLKVPNQRPKVNIMALAKPTVTANEVETVATQEVAQEAVQEVSAAGVDAIAEEVDYGSQSPAEEHADVMEAEHRENEVKAPAVQENTAVATARPAAAPMLGGSNFTKVAAENGFEGLELDAFSFPVINLPGEGYFQMLGDEESNLGKSFVFQAESTRARYRISETDDDDAEHYMTYDATGMTKADGTSAEAMLAQWAADSGEENYRPVIKKYVDVVATIVEADPTSEQAQELVGETVMLSIPKSGQGRFSGVMARGAKLYGGFDAFEIEASVGKKVKTAGGGFYPWNFKLSK
jgi:hypothetical protein